MNESDEGRGVQKMEKSLEEVKAFFANDRFAKHNGAVIEAFSDGYARCSIALMKTI